MSAGPATPEPADVPAPAAALEDSPDAAPGDASVAPSRGWVVVTCKGAAATRVKATGTARVAPLVAARLGCTVK